MKLQQIKRTKKEFQQPVNASALLDSLQRELNDECILRVNELKTGLFNNTYSVETINNKYILKVAPVSDADVFYNEKYLMLREQSLTDTLLNASDLIPIYLGFFKVAQRDAFLQPFIEGKLWDDVIDELTDDENAQLWYQLGQFAKTIHSVEGEAFGYPAPFRRFEKWSEFIEDNVAGLIEDAKRLGVYHQELKMYQSMLPNFCTALDSVKSVCLLHGDLWPRNVIIEGHDKNIRIKAVLDAERAFWGEPICDWVLIMYGVPDEFWQGYGNNIITSANPANVVIYKGMYFVLNIIEATRLNVSDEQLRKSLAKVNEELKRLRGIDSNT